MLLLSIAATYCLHRQNQFGLKEDFVNAMWAFFGVIGTTSTVPIMVVSDFGVEGLWVALPVFSVISMAGALISVAYRFGFLTLPE